MRISRPCYDKWHRCPGWNGGGSHFAKRNRCPDTGYVPFPEGRFRRWKFGRCNKCRVIVLPYVVRYLEPSWDWYVIKRRWDNWRYERSFR